MSNPTSEIQSIQFGIYSPDEIRKMGIEINSTKLNGENSVYDERLGKTTENGKCISCGLDNKKCPSHFGYIELNEYVIHPLYYKLIASILKMICVKCNSLIFSEDQLLLNGIAKNMKRNRFQKICEYSSKLEMCIHCKSSVVKLLLSTTDNTYKIVYKNESKEVKSVVLDTLTIKRKLDGLTDDQVRLLGINPQFSHPKNLILSVLPVLPPACRPFALSEGNICDDDLTNQIVDIVKINLKLKELQPPATRTKLIQSLKFKISTMYDNTKKKAKHQTNNRPINGVKERLSGKLGIIRNNLMGKRVDFSARTVIGAGPELRTNEMIVPEEVAETLTVPIMVNALNIKEMTNIVNSGKANIVIRGCNKFNLQYAIYKKGTQVEFGDVIVRDGKKIVYTKEYSANNFEVQPFKLKVGDKLYRKDTEIPVVLPNKINYELKIGDVVERQLMNGDVVLLNRQPTLHMGSMMAMRVKVMKYKTFRFNLACTSSFNADFDGDETNIHVPQSLMAQTELKEISMTSNHMISPQSSKPNLRIVQDGLLGSYLMTKEAKRISKDLFYNMSLCGYRKVGDVETELFNTRKLETIRYVYKRFGKNVDVYNSRALFSLVLPDDLYYEKKNDKNANEPVVKIYKGVLYEGTIDKSIIGSAHGSLIQIINKEYSTERASEFIDNVIFITNKWLSHFGYTIGLNDCMLSDETKGFEIKDAITKCYTEVKRIEESSTNNLVKEMRTTACLNKVKDVGFKIATDSMSSDNNFLGTVNSGSKGDFYNISQVTGLLGQQTINDKRIQPMLNHGTRALPHYPFENYNEIEKYECMGFIRNSFLNGLNEKEVFFHNSAGRIGVINTSLMTAKSGYLQRRIIKLTEDVKVVSDQTVRDSNNNIIQMIYNNTGFDPKCTTGDADFCDITRLVNRLNNSYDSDDEDDINNYQNNIDDE